MKIEIHSTAGRDPDWKYARETAEKLLSLGAEVYSPHIPLGLLPDGVKAGNADLPDVAAVLGGDGSIMRVLRRMAPKHIPVLGINIGHLGYLAELKTDELDRLSLLFSGDYTVEHRSLLNVGVIGRNGYGHSAIAVNDAVLSHGSNGRMLDIEVWRDGLAYGSVRADGYIVSTATGSTAYSLSAGGPVIEPSVPCLCMLPICPHSLTARPLIVPDDGEINLIYKGRGGPAYLAVDGTQTAELFAGDSVKITKSHLTADFIRFGDTPRVSFATVLREKMSQN